MEAFEILGIAAEIALLAALLRRAGDPRSEPRDLAPLIRSADRDRIERAAVLLL